MKIKVTEREFPEFETGSEAGEYGTEPRPPPYGPGTPTGYTDAQQAAMWYSRQRKRRALGPAPHQG